MLKVYQNHSLKELNGFRLDVKAEKFICVDNNDEIIDFLKAADNKEHFNILGEGSNILFTSDVKETIIHPCMKEIEVLGEDDKQKTLRVGAGKNWDEFVAYCVMENLGGIENLSKIPGSTGSAPVQNIGAYGVEVKECILWVEGIDIETKELRKLYNKDCKFAYRQSIFKNELKHRFIITHVAFKLSKHPSFNLSYGKVKSVFESKKKQNLQALRESIIEIRASKLPDHKVTGNVGSFFKNPVVKPEIFKKLYDKHPDIPSYPSGENIKVPAAWLIEKAGWKGVREGDTGTWPQQPLVIVNYGNSSGKQIFEFSEKIRDSVKQQFGIDLEREVNVI